MQLQHLADHNQLKEKRAKKQDHIRNKATPSSPKSKVVICKDVRTLGDWSPLDPFAYLGTHFVLF